MENLIHVIAIDALSAYVADRELLWPFRAGVARKLGQVWQLSHHRLLNCDSALASKMADRSAMYVRRLTILDLRRLAMQQMCGSVLSGRPCEQRGRGHVVGIARQSLGASG